jgi:hypothetical protein
VLLLAACGGNSSDDAAQIGASATVTTTGFEGHVIRGPVEPVCLADRPCEEPFAATFSVKRDGAQVAEFSSGADGYFLVFLEPGDYEIVPAAGAPISAPAQQSRAASVGETGLTRLELSFDTGIR